MANEDLQWLAQPPAPGEVRLHVAFGQGARVTPEIKDALERLAQAVEGEHPEVQGYRKAGGDPNSAGKDFLQFKFENVLVSSARGQGHVTTSDLHFTARIDKASATLF
jgi:hypothetical protein